MIVASQMHPCAPGGAVACTGDAYCGLAKICGVHENHVAGVRGEEALG